MEEIYQYFVNELGHGKKIHAFMPWLTRWFVSIGLFITIVADVIALFFISTWYIAMSTLILGIVIFLVFIYFYYRAGKKVLLQKYGIILTSRFSYSGKNYHNYINNELVKYIKSKDLYTEKKLKLLVERSKSKAEEKSIKQFFIPGIFAALTVPIWNQTAISLFKNVSGTTEIVTLFITLFIIIITMTFICSYYISAFRVLFGQKNQKYKQLNGHLEDIYMNLPEKATERQAPKKSANPRRF